MTDKKFIGQPALGRSLKRFDVAVNVMETSDTIVLLSQYLLRRLSRRAQCDHLDGIDFIGEPMKIKVALAALLVSGICQDNLPSTQEVYGRPAKSDSDSLSHYRRALILVGQHYYQEAALEFRAALDGNRIPAWTEVLSHLNLSKIFQASGEAERARNECVLAMHSGDATLYALDEAERCITSEQQVQGSRTTADDLPLPFGAFRLADGIVPPELTLRIKGEYSAEGLAAGLEGTVFVTGVINTEGIPTQLTVTRKLGLGLDEMALSAVSSWRFKPATYQGASLPVFITVPVDFRRPSSTSRWHLVGTHCRETEGTTQPLFASTFYPQGFGVHSDAEEEARILVAMGRQSTTVVSFEVNEHGYTERSEIEKTSAPVWGNKVLAIVDRFRFKPGMKDGNAARAACTATIIWGDTVLGPSVFAQELFVVNPWSAAAAIHSTRLGHPPIVTMSAPEYTTAAIAAKLTGKVRLSLVVDEDGSARKITVIGTLGMGLDAKAVESLEKWRFRTISPYGRPEPVPATVDVEFQLPPEK